jgi:hypothetical protein
MLAILLQVALLGGGLEDPPPPPRPLSIPGPVRWSEEVAEIQVNPDRTMYPVAVGVQVTARIHGDMVVPLTDPGRTVIRVELVFPLLAKNGRTILLPVGTQLTGKVHLLRGEFRFVDFQSFLLPDGRLIGLPDDVFRLGPGSTLTIQDGTPAMLTVARPLRMEAFGPTR